MRFVAVVVFGMYTFPALADLDKPTTIDRVYVHEKTSQAALALVVNYPLEESVREFEAKLGTYTRFVESGALYSQYPEVQKLLPVVIVLSVMIPPNARARELLQSKRRELEKAGYEVWVTVYNPETGKLQRE